MEYKEGDKGGGQTAEKTGNSGLKVHYYTEIEKPLFSPASGTVNVKSTRNLTF